MATVSPISIAWASPLGWWFVALQMCMKFYRSNLLHICSPPLRFVVDTFRPIFFNRLPPSPEAWQSDPPLPSFLPLSAVTRPTLANEMQKRISAVELLGNWQVWTVLSFLLFPTSTGMLLLELWQPCWNHETMTMRMKSHHTRYNKKNRVRA